jgi:pilus assembly protein CpaD
MTAFGRWMPGSRMAVVCTVAAVLVLSACEAPRVDADFRKNHPLVVGKETVSLSIQVPFARESLNVEEKARIRGFVKNYLDRGEGLVTVEMVGTDGAAGEATSAEWLRWARDTLIGEGLRGDEVSVLAGTRAGETNALVATYSAATVTPPECRNWSSPATLTTQNRPHSNFGCSIQRNLGLMVQNPADLKRAGTLTSRDPHQTIRVIVNHRAGTETGSQKSAAQQSGLGAE